MHSAAAEYHFGPRPPLLPATARVQARDADARVALLVEGWSDQAAVLALARRQGVDRGAAGVVVVPIGGITNLGAFVQQLGHAGLGLALGGLCDAAEEDFAMRTLERTGLGPVRTRAELEARGFFVCEADLEDELVRAAGLPAVEAVLHREGELASFRRFQEQPAQRDRGTHAQLRRFMGTRARRKIRYGALLVEAIELPRMPRPLRLVVEYAATRGVLQRHAES